MEKIKTFIKSVINKFKESGTKGIIILAASVVLVAAVVTLFVFFNPFASNAPVTDTDTEAEVSTESSSEETDSDTEAKTDTSADTDTDSDTDTDTDTDTETASTSAESQTSAVTDAPPAQDNNQSIDVNVDIDVSGGGNSNSNSGGASDNKLGSDDTNGRIHCYADAPSLEYEDTSSTLPYYPLKQEGATDPNGVYNRPWIKKSDMVPGVLLKGDADYSTTLIGYDNFLFCGDTMGDYDGTSLYAESRINSLVSKVVKQKEWLESKGKKLYIVMVPNKNSVYPEYMPDNYSMASYRRIDQVINALSAAGITVIDGRDPLIAAKNANSQRLLYYKTDTHWNNHGGFEVYKALMAQIKKDFPNAVLHTRSDYQINYAETYMKDQAYYLGYYDATSEIGPIYTLKTGNTADLLSYQPKDKWGQFAFAYEWPDGYCDRLYYMTFINYDNKNAPNMYILRDSYSIALIPFLKDSFYKSTYNWSYYFSKNDILKSNADVVIIECVEKHIKDMLQAGWGN